jgi:hypothetical protein
LDKIYVYPHPNPIGAIRFKFAQHAKTTFSGAFGWSKTKKTFAALLGQPNDPTFCGHYLRCSFRPPLSVRLPEANGTFALVSNQWDSSRNISFSLICSMKSGHDLVQRSDYCARAITPALKGGGRGVQVTTDLLRRYVMERKAQLNKWGGAPQNSTINRELALLRSAFYLGYAATPPKDY